MNVLTQGATLEQLAGVVFEKLLGLDPDLVTGACVLVMILTAAYSVMIQVRYRFLRSRQQSPVSGMASGLFLSACGVFLVEAVHPASVLPPAALKAGIMALTGSAICLATWSFVMNRRATAIVRASEVDERLRSWSV